jgi:hypothetical protein
MINKSEILKTSKIKKVLTSVAATTFLFVLVFSFQNCGNKMSTQSTSSESLATLSPVTLKRLSAGNVAPAATNNFSASVAADNSINVVINVKFDKTSFAANEAITGHVSLISNTAFTGNIVFSGRTQAAEPFNIPYNNVSFAKDVQQELSFSQINGGHDPFITVNGDYPWTAKVSVGAKTYSTTRIVHIGTSSSQYLEYATVMKIAPGPYAVGKAIDGQICIQTNIAFTGYASGTVQVPACAGGTVPFKYTGINFKVGSNCFTLDQVIGRPAKPTCAGKYTLDVALTVAGEASANITWDIDAN